MRSTVVYNLVPRACGSYQERNSWGVEGATPRQCCNIAVLPDNFNNFKDTLVGQKLNVIQQNILYNLLSNSLAKILINLRKYY